ncbi:hypothetical protein [Tropicimonas marinistellae]|uniref:hypothetical protein n=1 Tax=Tropicimonas marinistellae TaxID=1739787 RepID=UPI00082E01C1|nr:hypothetical protein [Tropicimonas marinistellae]
MTDDPFDRLQPVGEQDEVGPDPNEDDAGGVHASSPPIPRGGRGKEALPPRGAADARDLPPAFPVRPVGAADGVFYFLSARGELVPLTARDLSNRTRLFSLFAGVADPLRWLRWIAKPLKGDKDFNTNHAAEFLITACSELPLYAPNTQVRSLGTWRGPGGAPLAHVGDTLLLPDGAQPAGAFLERAIYPAAPGCPTPGSVPAAALELAFVRDRIRDTWAWGRPIDADVAMGWVGQAVLGQFPRWRTHMWIQGKLGSGKSTLVRILSSLLGGMSGGVKKGASEAAVRQATNRQAIVRIFDEAETTGEAGQVEAIIALFRLMSDADGAQVERGTAQHAAIRFALFGAGLLASIVPGIMQPQDRSRFVMLSMQARPDASDATDAAARLADLEEDALNLGPAVWRRMLDLAPQRWDDAHRRYAALVQTMGGDSRAGDTIGAVLAGWDLMLHDTPLDDDRLVEAQAIARPLLMEAKEAQTEGEGERCLRTLLAYLLQKDHGGVVQVSELVASLQGFKDMPLDAPADVKLLARLGLRVVDGDVGKRELFVINGEHPQLNRAFGGTRWRGGGHRAALLTLDGARPAPGPLRCGDRKVRGVLIPVSHLPGAVS